MADPSVFDPVRLSAPLLAAMDWRPYHFAVQPYHYLVRVMHLVATGAFFGGIGLLDLRLLGWRATLPLRAFAEHVLPWLWATFGVTVATGVALFLYDPLRIGSRAYWTPKLIAVGVGLLNAAMFHRTGYLAALAAGGRMPASARVAGAVSLACWTAAVVFSSLNTEAAPRVLLR